MTDSYYVKQQKAVYEDSYGGGIIERHLQDYRNLIKIISKCRHCQDEFKQLQLSKNNRGMSDTTRAFRTSTGRDPIDILDSR